MGYQSNRYIFTKRGVFYYSRRVPTELQPLYSKTRIRACLHTRVEQKAARAADQLSAQLEGIWAQARLEKTLSTFRQAQLAPVTPTIAPIPLVRDEAVTLSDALDLYVRLKGKNKAKSFLVYTQRNMAYAIECLGDAAIRDLGRSASGKFRLEPAILLLRAIKGLLRYPDFPDEVGHSHPHLRFLQNRNNLFGRQPLLLYSRSPRFQDGKSAEKLTSNPDHFARGTLGRGGLILAPFEVLFCVVVSWS